MAGTYKTPGVYVEEITKFPPSVAEVETAIPAFIGYTRMAKKAVDDDLLMVPTRVKNYLEFVELFGDGPTYTVTQVVIDNNKKPIEKDTTVSNNTFYLHDAVRLFYDNGSGPCYIISVGNYSAPSVDYGTDTTGLKGGLKALSKFDEPTLILFPDAVNLSVENLGALQRDTLQQCQELGDRFGIFDIKPSIVAGKEDLDASLLNFRNNVGMNNLKYGSAFYPWVKTVYEQKFKMREINKVLKQPNAAAANKKLYEFFTDADVVRVDRVGGVDVKVTLKGLLQEFDKLVADNDNLDAKFKLVQTTHRTAPAELTFEDTFKVKIALLDTAAASVSAATFDAQVKPAMDYLWTLLRNLDALVPAHTYDLAADLTVKTFTANNTPLITNLDLQNTVKAYIESSVRIVMQKLIDLDAEAKADIFAAATITFTAAAALDKGILNTTVGSAAPADCITGLSVADKKAQLKAAITAIFNQINIFYSTILQMGLSFEDNSDRTLAPMIPFYSSIIATLNSKITNMPPSGAVAGVFAFVDRERGVWKAPANVSINGVSGITQFIDDSIQENMNVDVNAGKSINAIRSFYGKGIMVWGSRTLAGNDNEWRYIPVRRFYNYVEESCKKSTSWAVFEPNDANTWLRIKTQIENFLFNLWNRGALAGAKPEHAYTVKCGLGITMTPQDILEGRLNVEVAMAAVRPAEFVILKFSHKLQQS